MQSAEWPGPSGTRFAGIDSGSVRCGVAIADPSATIATPLAVLPTEPRETLAARLSQLLAAFAPYELVVGLPLDQRSREGPAAQLARELGESLGRALQCPLHFIDERFTTRAVTAVRREAGLRGRRLKADIDAGAAAALLQAFIDRRHAGA